MRDEQLLEIGNHRTSDAFDELERAVLDYAEALSRTPADTTDALVETLKKELGDEGLVELTTAIAWENFRARFNRGFDVAAQGFAEGACCAIPQAP